MPLIIPVILSGGSGTRLWPLSRKQRPKQFMPLLGDKSLFQNTLERLSNHSAIGQPLVVCNEEHRFMVAEQLREIAVKTQGIILEPIGRNTAPAIALAALYMQQLEKDDNTVLLVLPADHIIQNVSALHRAIDEALTLALEGNLVTFGIVPQHAETGYGYIPCVFLMEHGYAGSLLNIGTGQDVTIRELAETIMDVVGFTGRIVFDASKPDGTMRKVLDVSRLNTQNWKASKALTAGISDTYKAYRSTL